MTRKKVEPVVKFRLVIEGLDTTLKGPEELLKVAVGRGIDTSGGDAVSQALTNLKEWNAEQTEAAIAEILDVVLDVENDNVYIHLSESNYGFREGAKYVVNQLKTHLKASHE